jgi:Trk K+ transport system NAD-binding subunit/Kef-type K+ transport system membrane component KefB
MPDTSILLFLAGFFLIAISANEIAKVFQKIKFPLITGLIVTGIIAGSSVLNFIPDVAVKKLNFLNEIALSMIAFAAGSELYLKELRSRLNSIKWMSIGQLVITFVMTSVAVYYLADIIPFMSGVSVNMKLAISILFGTIFVARSPSSAIAIINEMRANGPYTKTVLGTTVVIDVLVIILFAITFSIAKAFISGETIGFTFLFVLMLELLVSLGLGFLLGRILQIPFNLKLPSFPKEVLIVVIGYAVYLFSHFVRIQSEQLFHHEFIIEPLLISIIGSFVLTNYSNHRIEFSELLEKISPFIYIVFFTLIGASLSLQVLMSVFWVALFLFVLRMISMFFGGFFGVYFAKDPKKYRFISWMPYLPQAGVALGLATIIAHEFPTWGHEFETIIIAIIVINQLIGPPLFKWALLKVNEAHTKASLQEFDGTRDAVIFGVDNKSVALSKQLEKHRWETRIVSHDGVDHSQITDATIVDLNDLSWKSLEKLQLEKTEAIVLLLSDKQNYKIAEIVYEHIGTKTVIVRLNKRKNFEKFHALGSLIIEPATAMVGLLDHFVRSPNAASLLLGMDEGQDTMDLEIRNNDLHGLRLRDLRFPPDVLVLSIKRNEKTFYSHGYTRLRMGDIITLVGSEDSLERLKFKFDT